MLQWILGFGLIYFAIYLVYTRKLQTPRFTFAGYWVSGFMLAIFSGITTYSMLEAWKTNIPKALLLLLLAVAFIGFEVLFCLQVMDQCFGKYRQMLRLVELYNKGLLVETPFKQGQTLYWIDFHSAIPCVRKMFFVVVVSGCYIGIYEDGQRLVSVRQVFTDKQSAKQMLATYNWNLYAHHS